MGKRIRITAANVVNVNATAAGLETLVESVLFWRKQTELEQQARMSLEMVSSYIPLENSIELEGLEACLSV